MYSDSQLNFSKIIDECGPDEASQILQNYAVHKPYFLLDCGIKADDIFHRAQNFKDCINQIDDDSAQKILNNMIHFSAGIMPDSESVDNRFEEVENLERTISDFRDSDDEFSSRLVAIGPCGIDHDWDSVEYEGRDHDFFDNQTIGDERDLFALQLTLGKKLNLPVIVHSRKGFKDTADVLKAVKWNRGVIHGFSYTQSELEYFLNLGWYISFSGTVTYSGKKTFNDMADLVAYVPKDRILIETDSPYYAPVPLKKTLNNPQNITYIYEYIASKRGTTIHKLCDAVDSNCQKLFNL